MEYKHEHCVADIETDGLPSKEAKWDSDYMQFPHLVQLSWKLKESDDVQDYIIKPEGYVIPKELSEIHGITQEMALEKGVPFAEIIPKFIEDCENSRLIVGHNLYFDTSIIKANVLRLVDANKDSGLFLDLPERVIAALDKEKRMNTMSYSVIKFCAIPFPNSKPGSKNYKYPKLTELYFILFGEEFNAHNSKDDVLATERCYYKLLELGILQPKPEAKTEE